MNKILDKENNKALTVYKASAGSGKTFTLAVEFIKLLITDPTRYENILAVTFTNKATEEMKHRIVSQLYGISRGLKSSDNYLEKITKELNLSEAYVRSQATKALYNLLHNYNQFRIQTIDSFFQSVLRNMMKELGLGNNMRISLQDDQVISEAVDSMLETIQKDKNLMSWILQFIEEKMDDEKSWNVSSEIKAFGKNLSKEFFKTNEHLLSNIANDQKFFSDYKSEMRSIITQTRKKYEEYGRNFDTMMQEEGITMDDFTYKTSSVASYFTKLKNGNFGLDEDIVTARIQKGMTEPSAWGKERIAELAKTRFIPYLNKVDKERLQDLRKAKSANTTLQNISKMRLLFSIREEMEDLNSQNARFMLSNTQTTLRQMISAGDETAPFIYEKIGAYLKHIMIDEFQDTSTVQWQNFKVLLDNCISETDTTEGSKTVNNLIVGDVKQSIYRFRSGDWRLLNDIDSYFTDELGANCSEKVINTVQLQTNWRSERNIIDFNNAFFRQAIKIEADRIMPEDLDAQEQFISENSLSPDVAKLQRDYAEKLRRAYSDVEQLVPADKPKRGLVKVEFLTEDKKEDMQAVALEHTLNYVKSLITLKVPLSDIAILVRGNDEASLVANYFAENSPETSIISDQAFMLSASSLVMMIVSTMRLLHNEEDIRSRSLLLKLYTSYVLHEDINDNILLTDQDAFARYMPEEIYSAESRQKMQTMSLYELSEYIFRVLHLDQIKGQEPYACAFFDGLKKFLDDNGAILNDFLKYWESELQRKPISIGSVSSIRVITIHKSKGLEYPHVIMPFCNWKTTTVGGETLWCKTEEAPFSKLPFIPVDYRSRSSLDNTCYEQFGAEEWMQEIVDNLNLLYVAFTRAGRSLYIISDQNPKEEYRSHLIYTTLKEMEENHAISGAQYYGISEMGKEKKKSSKKSSTAKETEKEECSFCFGQHYLPEQKAKSSDNIFEQSPEDVPVEVHSYDNDNIDFRQSNKSREFANDTLDDADHNRYTTMGSILHALFSQIHTLDDVEKTLRQFEFDGIIYDDTLSPEELREQLSQKFNNATVKDWFSDRWTVFNECNIMRLVGGKIVNDRPDRVITDGHETIVIDYKFGKRNKSYADQVKRYMKLMTSMGYPNVKGYLWYVQEEDGVEIIHNS